MGLVEKKNYLRRCESPALARDEAISISSNRPQDSTNLFMREPHALSHFILN